MRAALIPALLCGVALAAQSWPTFFSAYLDGRAAQKRGDHAQAVRAFTRAIALEPQPGQRVKTYGLNFLPNYFPYLRLAESDLATGDLAGAETALRQSAQLGAEPESERAALLDRLRRLREAQIAAAAPPVAVLAPAQAPVPPVTVPAAVPAPASSPAGPPQPSAARPQPTAASPAPALRAVPAPSPGPGAGSAARPGPAPARAAAEAPPATPATALPPGAASTPVPAPIPAFVAPPIPAGPAASPRAGTGLRVGLAALASAVLALTAGWALRRRRGSRPPAHSRATLAGPAGADGGGPEQEPGGQAFGPYLAQRVLGRGGCATAYYGRHQVTGAEVAIKVPHPHLAEDPEFRARFRREASLGALLEHPRVVRIVDPGPSDGALWLAMAFIRGTTLEAVLAGQSGLPVRQALAIAGDVAEAIGHAHGKGVVHRDLKPGNVMLTDDGAVVMDFGIARVLDTAMTVNTMFLGTPMYSAPEAIMGAKAGPPADRYALGIILFEMLAGQPPFSGASLFELLEAQRAQPLPDLAGLRPHLPPRLIRLVQRLCAKNPEDRPEDLEALTILRELQDGVRT